MAGPRAISCSPSDARPSETAEGKGPLKWASFQDYVKEQWQGFAREYGAGKAAADFWEESAQARRRVAGPRGGAGRRRLQN